MLASGLEQRLDQSLIAQADTAASLFEDEFSEMHDDVRAAIETVSEVKSSGGLIAVLKAGRVLAASLPQVPADLASLPRDGVTVLSGAHAATHPVTPPGGSSEYLMVSYARLDSITQSLLLVRRVLFFALPALLAIAALGGFWLTTRSLAPLSAMAAQAQAISSSNLDARLEIGRAAEELSTLAASFNELLGRLDQSFGTMRRFVADASHELRTPLAVIRAEAEVALAANRSPAEYREALAVIHDEARRLSILVEDLLNLARADAGHVTLQVQDFYFNDLVAASCRRAHPSAAARGVILACETPGDLAFRGDEELLGRLIGNLVDNAIRYTPAGGKVTVSAESAAGGVLLRVSDTGIGIPPEAAAHVFERFYRADAARSRSEGGFGLGLSIVRWIAESHRGSVVLDTQPALGTTFTVTLPG